MDKKTQSDKQIAANRRNGKKSTDPRTEEGKQRSQMNSLKHGMTAERLIATRTVLGENADDHKTLRESLEEQYRHQVPAAILLIDVIAINTVRLHSALRAEAAEIEHERKTKEKYFRERQRAWPDIIGKENPSAKLQALPKSAWGTKMIIPSVDRVAGPPLNGELPPAKSVNNLQRIFEKTSGPVGPEVREELQQCRETPTFVRER